MAQQETDDRPTLLDPDGSLARAARQQIAEKIERYNKLWAEAAPGVEPVINEYVARSGVVVEETMIGHKTLSWVDGDYGNSISMSIHPDGEDLKLWVARWRDNEDLSTRTCFTLSERMEAPVLEEPFREAVDMSLRQLPAIIRNPRLVLFHRALPRPNQRLDISLGPIAKAP